MPVHYCLELTGDRYTTCAHPWDLTPLREELGKVIKGQAFEHITHLPSYAWTEPKKPPSRLTAHLAFSSHDEARAVYEVLRASDLNGCGFGQDPILSTMDVWSPAGPGVFGDRDAAERLTGVRALKGATGEGVNVLIVDRGLERGWVGQMIARMAKRRGLPDRTRPEPDVLGWTRFQWNDRTAKRYVDPGASGSKHAFMIARNVLAIAPEATIWDAPLLPSEDELDAPPSPASANALFHWIKSAVVAGRMDSWNTRKNGWVEVATNKPWIVVNAWGVLDPESDQDLKGDYADDPDHFLVKDMAGLDAACIDVVFAAGNCGEPCTDQRCGQQDTGPGRSIFGLNAHPDVLSVGAVRADGLPVALSAQGPGRLAKRGSCGTDYSRNKYAHDKPDICGPSHFRESDDDAAELNTGTSAACGFAAGVLAALRSVHSAKELKPSTMRALLRKTARRPAGQLDWDPRLGWGIINAEEALACLNRGWSDEIAELEKW
jgi:hypothetical protein